ncbi:MAG TPA: branched-chain amino acid ABC transporter permease [Solirubrobacteraceae bacterium]|jgi:branched-chain amino acid transport system permease protein|nr:branched-chain amino acid ABC transporter permease [Solirubrobacteraceae bacterium]
MEASGVVTRVGSSLRISRLDVVHGGVAVVGVLFALFALPQLLSPYWIDTSTTTVIYAIAALGVALLVGRIGMISLGQVAVLALGAWVAAKFCFSTTLPYPIVLLVTGAMTMVMGTLIGLPALRVSGLYLALVTLMLAGAITVVLTVTNFPNGGTGFLGYNDNYPGTVRRPSIATSDAAFFRYSIIVAALMFALVLWHLRSKPGRAWAAIRQSEPAALTAGVNVTVYKMWAFALTSFITGVAGGLLGSSQGKLYTFQFPTQNSVILFAVVLMGGIYTMWGAVIASVLLWVVPALFTIWGIDSQIPTILFGVGVLQVVTTAPAGIAHQFPRDMLKLGKLLYRLVRRPATAGST